MYVTRISRYIERSVLSVVSRNRGRSWNVTCGYVSPPPTVSLWCHKVDN